MKVRIPESWAFFEDRQGKQHRGGSVIEIDDALAASNGFTPYVAPAKPPTPPPVPMPPASPAAVTGDGTGTALPPFDPAKPGPRTAAARRAPVKTAKDEDDED